MFSPGKDIDEDNFLVVETDNNGKDVFYRDEVKAEAEVHFEGVSANGKDAFFSVTVRANTTPPEDRLKTIAIDLSTSVFWDINQDYSSLSQHPSKSLFPPVIDAVFEGLIQHIHLLSQEKERNYHLNLVFFSDKTWVYPDKQIPISGEQNKAVREKLVAELREIQRIAKLKYQATESDYDQEPLRPIHKSFLNLTPVITKLEQELKQIPVKYQQLAGIVAGATHLLAADAITHELCDPKFLCEILQITDDAMNAAVRPLKKQITKKNLGMPPDTKFENVSEQLDLQSVATEMSVTRQKTLQRVNHFPAVNTLLLREYNDAEIEKMKMLSYQGAYPGSVRVLKSDQFNAEKIASELGKFPETVVTGQFQFSLHTMSESKNLADNQLAQFIFNETNQAVRTVVAIPADKLNGKAMKSRLARDGVETGTGLHEFVMDKEKKASLSIIKERADAWVKAELLKNGLHPNDELRINQALHIYVFKNHFDKLYPVNPTTLRNFLVFEKKDKPLHIQILMDNFYDAALNGDLLSVTNVDEIYKRWKERLEKADIFGQILQKGKAEQVPCAQSYFDSLIEQNKLQLSAQSGFYSGTFKEVVTRTFAQHNNVVRLTAPVGLKKRR